MSSQFEVTTEKTCPTAQKGIAVKMVALQEDREYSQGDLINRFGKQEDISVLRQQDFFCRTKTGNYSPHFVGLVEYDGQENHYLIFFYPKYMKDPPIGDNGEKKDFESFSLAFKALYQHQKYSEGNINPDETSEQKNVLSLAIDLVQDYLQNGVYENTITRSELCGQGEIDWQKTIDTISPVIQQNRPAYMQYWTNERVSHSNTLIARIHECIVSECSRMISGNLIADLLDMETPVPYEGELSDFGSYDAILYLINRELSVQFVTQKQNLLRMMALFIEARIKKEDKCENNLSFYGTKAFHVVWEAACSAVFGDEKDNPIDGEIIKCPKIRTCMEDGMEDEEQTWKDLIPGVVWNMKEGKEKDLKNDLEENEKASLRPDFLALKDNVFYILDAKYYCPEINEKKVSGVPGIGDIDKQHLYQLAYAPLAKAEGWKMVNAFLMPKQLQGNDKPKQLPGNVKTEHAGIVYNPIFGYISQFEFVPIQVLYLDPNELFEAYVGGKTTWSLDLDDKDKFAKEKILFSPEKVFCPCLDFFSAANQTSLKCVTKKGRN